MPLSLFLLALGAFAFGTEASLIAGLLPQLSAALNVPAAQTGRLLTVFAAVYAISAPLMAMSTATLDRRLLLTGCVGAFSALNLVISLAPDYTAFAVCFAGCALTAALYLPAAVALAAAIVPPGRQGRALGYVAAGQMAGTAVGVPAGALIAEAFGWRATFLFIAGIGLVAMTGALSRMPKGIEPAAFSFRERLAPLRNRSVQLAIGFIIVWSCGGSAFNTYFAPYMSLFGITGPAFALALGCLGIGTILSGLFGGWATDRFGAPNVLIWFTAAICVLLAGLSALPEHPDAKWIMLLLLSIWPLFGYGLIPARQAELIAGAPQSAPVLVSLYGSAVFIGIASGSAAGGEVVERLGAGYLPLITLCLGGIGLALLLAERAQR